MGKPMVASLYVFAAILAVAVAGPIELRSGSCARQCTESNNNKFQYSNGKSYSYDYEMETITTLEGTTSEASRLHMKCKVELHVISPCEMVMKLSGVTLEQSSKAGPRSRVQADEMGTFRRSLESYPLRFAFQDGSIEHVCPSKEESIEVLNIKRGILSALQTNTETLDGNEKVVESDVSGKCTTVYEVAPKGWKTQTLRKTKDLSSCTQDYEETSSKSQPLVKGTQECEQVFSNKRLQKVECKETHKLRAFSRHQKNGAVTQVKMSLNFANEGRSGFTGNEYFHSRRQLSFDHSEENSVEQSRLFRKAEEALSALCEASKDDIRPNVPALFTTLVHRIKHLQHSQLVELQERVSQACSQNPRGKRMFLDAVTMCGSTGAARMMSGLIEEGKVSAIDVELWLESLAFVKNPDREMLSAVTPLLNRKENFLAVSALVNTYCTKYSDCYELQEVRQIARKISSALSNGCTGSNKDDIMMALKAMGNMGSSAETEEVVRKCFDNTKIDTEIRVAAIQAFRRAQCNKAPMAGFTTMFRNTNENVEIRIASFLAMMKCPSFETFSDVRDVLKDEKINQVGSFVWSYIRQAAKQPKANPEFNNLISDRTLVNKFKTDAMKYSRAYGSSFFLESMDIGASADGNVIFTPEGYLPRSVMLNLTVDILGSSMNILELEGRAEGMERLVESLFGPDGYFKNSNENQESKNTKTREENAIEVMGNKYNAKGRFEREPTASVDMKFFGNSMMYERFGLTKDGKNSEDSFMTFETMSLPEILAELAKERDINFNKNILLFDHSFTFPTVAGFPLQLTLEGSASVGLKLNGKMDMRSLENIDVSGKIQPSGAIEMAAILSVVASKEVSSGLKLTATLHSSTFLDGLVEVRSGRVIRSQINVPRDNIELFDLQTKIFLVRNEEQEVPAMFNDNEVNNNMLCYSKLFGMEICGQIQIPSTRNNMPVFPLSGSASIKAIMRKTDPSLSQYNMELRWNPEGEGKAEAVLKFNTPGSTVDREVSTGFTISKEDQTFSLWARYPNKRINVNGKRVNTEVDKRITFGVSFDDVEQFSVDAALGMEGVAKNGIRYSPSFVVRGPNSNTVLSLRGQGSIRPGQKFNGELIVEGILEGSPLVLKGDLSFGDRSEVKFSVSSAPIETSVTALVNRRNGAYTVKGNVEYRFFNSRRNKLELSGKFRDLSANSLIKYSGTGSLQSTAYPEYSSTLAFETQLTKGHIENTLEITMGQGKKNLQKIIVQEILRWEGTLPENKVDATLRFSYPEKYLEYMMKVEHENTMISTNDKFTVKYAPEREVVAVFGGNVNGNPMNINANFQLESSYSGKICSLECGVKQQAEEYEFVFAATQKKNKMRAQVSVADRSDDRLNSYVFKSELALPNSRKPMTATGDVSFSRGHYTMNTEMNMGTGVYGGKVEYTTTSRMAHRFSAVGRTPKQAYSAEGSMEGSRDTVSLKGNIQGDRRMTANIDLKNIEMVKSASVNFLWDADRDMNKKFNLESQLKCGENRHQGQISVSYPGRTISSSFEGGMDGQMSKRMKANGNFEIEWQTGSKIRIEMSGNTMKRDSGMNIFGDARLTTPFKGVESMAISIQHSNPSPKEMKTEVIAQWPRNKVSFVTEGKYQLDESLLMVDIATRLTTTIRDYESMLGQAILKFTPNDIATTVSATWSKKVFEIAASGTKEPMSVMINITMPSQILSQASASMALDYQAKRNVYKIDSDVTWNGRNQINVGLEGRSNMASRKRSCSGSMTVTSTIPGFEKFVTKSSYIHADREMKMDADFLLNREKVNFAIIRVNRNTKYVYDVENRISYTSTIKNYRNGELRLTYNQDSNKINSILSAKLPYEATFNMEVAGVQTAPDAKELTLTYSANNFYGQNKPTAFTFLIKRAAEKLNSNAQLTIGESVSRADLTASANFGSQSGSLNTRLNIKAPSMLGHDEINFSFDHQRSQMRFTTECSASASRKEFRATNEIKFTDMTNFETKLTVSTPYRNYRAMEMNILNSNDGKVLKHKSDMSISGNAIMRLNGEFGKQQKQKNMALICKIDADMPFLEHKVVVDAKHEMNLDRMIHRPKINLEWDGTQRLAFEGNFAPMEASPVIEGRLSSTIPSLEVLGFVARYKQESIQKCGEGSLRWAADKEVTWRACVEPENNKVDLVVTTPYNGYETVNVRGDLSKANSEKSANLAVEYGRNRIALNGKYVSKRRGTEMSFGYSTPFYGWTSGSFRGAYMGKMNDFNVDLSSEWAPSNKMSMNLVHKIVSGRLSNKLTILTPFRGYRTMRTVIDTDFDSSKKTASFVGEMEKKSIRTNAMLENDFPRSLLTSFEMSSPFMEEVKFSSDFKKAGGNANIATSVQWGQTKNLRANAVFEADMPSSMTGTLDMTSTIDGLEDVKLNGNYRRTRSGCNVATSFKWGATEYLRTKIDFENELPRSLVSNIELASSLRGLEVIKFNGNYKGQRNSFNLVNSFQWNRDNLRTSLDMQNQYPRNMMTKFEMSSTYKGMESVKLNGDYNETPTGCQITANYETGRDNLRSRFIMDNQFPRSIMSEFETTSTFEKFTLLRLKGNYQNIKKPSLTTSCEWGNNKYVNTEMSVENRMPRSMASEFIMSTSFNGMESIKMNANYEKSTDGGNLVALYQWSRKTVRANAVYAIDFPRTIMGSFELTTPYRGYESVKLNGDFKNQNGRDIEAVIGWGENKAIRTNMALVNNLPQAIMGSFDLTTPFRGYESVKLNGDFKNTNGREVEAVIGWGQNQAIRTNMALENNLPNSIKGSFDLRTPFRGYESVKLNGDFKNTNGRDIEAVIGWGDNQVVRTNIVLENKLPKSIMGSFELRTPFRGYEHLQVNGDFKNMNGRDIEAVIGWGENKVIRTNMALENKLPRSILGSFELRTPFENFEEIKMNGNFKKSRVGGNFKSGIQYAPDKVMTLNGEMNEQEASLTLDTPFRPLRNVRLTGSLGNDNLRLTGEWENPSNKVDLSMRMVKSDNQLEASIELSTPFRNYRKFTVSTELFRFDKEWRHTKGNLKIQTPFQILKNFEMEGMAKLFPANYQIELTIVPSEKSNRMVASGFARRVGGLSEFQIAFDKYSISGNFKGDGTMDAALKVNAEEEHSATLTYKNTESGLYGFETKIYSSVVPSKEVGASFNVDVRDSRRMNADASVEYNRNAHKVSGTMKMMKHGYECEAKVNSPSIPSQEISFTSSFNNKRSKLINGQVAFNYNAKSHAFEFSFDRSNGNDMSGSAELRCPLISNTPLRLEGKIAQPEDASSFELSFTATLPNGRHSCTTAMALGTNAVSSAELSVTIDSPLLESKTMSFSTKMAKPSDNSFEGTMSLNGVANGESRLSFNLRRDEYKSVEGFVTVNLPAGPMRMFRADMQIKSDGRPMNADLSMDIQTSIRSFRRLTTTLKTKTTENTWDVSANLRLPVKGMENVALLAIIHKNEKKITPRITVTIPSHKIVFFGNMEKEGSEITTSLGYEINDQKTEATFELKGEELRLTLTTPYKNYERYSLLCSMKDEKNKKTVRIAMEDPANKKIVAQLSGMYNSLINFNIEADLKTPFEGLLDNNLRLRNQYRRGRMVSSFQHTSANRRRSSFLFDHQFTSSSYNGNIEILTPFEFFTTSKVTYGYATSSGNTKLNIQSEMNGRSIMQIEMNGDNEEKRFTISFPNMPYTLMGSVKTGSVFEYSLTSISRGRTMGFTSMYQKTDRVLSHGAKLTWDEKENSVVSYEWRSSALRTSGSEMYGRINFPTRSFAIKADHESTDNGRKAKCDFFWDAARNENKQIKLAVEHDDNSGYRTMAHKVQVSIAYPEMNKEIMTKTEFNWTPKDIMAKAEIEFSQNPQQNIFVELRGQDLSKSRKDSNYQFVASGRHAASRVEFQLVGNAINNAEETSYGLKSNFLGHDGRQRIKELRGKIQKLKQNMELMARNNEDTMVLNGRYFNRDRMMTIEFDHNVNSEKVADGSIRWNGRERSVEGKLNSGNEEVNMRATVQNGDMFHMEVSHLNSNQEKVSDARLHLSLKESKLLESRVNWRPEVFDETYERMNNAYNSMRVNKYSEKSYQDTKYQFAQAFSRMERSLTPEFSNMINSISDEMDSLSQDYNKMGQKLNQMYRRNEFYIRNIADSCSGVFEYISDIGCSFAKGVSNIVSSVSNGVLDTCVVMRDACVNTVAGAAKMYMNAQRRLVRSIEKVEEMLDEMMLDMISYCIGKTFDFVEYYERVMESMLEKSEAVFGRVSKYLSPMMKSIEKACSNLYNKVERLMEEYMGDVCQNRPCQYLASMLNNLKECVKQISYSSIAKFVQSYTSDMAYAAGHATEYVAAAYNYVQDNSHLTAINDAAAKTFNKVRETAYHLGLDTLTFNLMEEIYAKSMQAIWSTLQMASQDLYEMRNNVRYVYEPESGRLELEMSVPNTKFTLEDMLSITQNPDIQRLWDMKEKVFNFDSNSIWDMYYQYKRYMDPYYWIPPFHGRAMLAGNQHFMTFDNFHFDYAGECSFLLARDFVDGNFSVSVNYVQDENLRAVRKSMVLFTNNKKVEISNDHKVTLNDVKVELPQELTPGGVTISWTDGVIAVKDERRGMSLKCNFEHDLCTLDVSGFYFAKTGGLFGTFNYEPHMDMTTRENQVTDNVEEFASSWKLGGSSCKTKNKALATSNDYRANEECKKIFESNDSPMRPCFKILSPEPFMRMCLNDLSAVRESEQSVKTCTAIAAYVEKCKIEGVEMRMPKHCVRCERHDGQWMEGGDLIKMTNSPSPSQAADVVFVVEQKPCNRDIPMMLNKLAALMEEGLRKENYRKIRFAVVGFGGDGVHGAPHVVTTQGKAFGSSRTISTALDNLPLSKSSENGNVFMALRYAAGLPFLAGATKNFIVAKCSECKAQEMKADYSEMLRTMLDGEINLHMLMNLKLETRSSGNSNKAKRVLGLDSKFAYTTKDMKDNELGGDETLLAQLRVPKDLCVPLALEINGSVFSTAKLLDSKRNTNKKTLEILAKRVLKTALPSECQLCECLATASGTGKSVCQRCVSPVVASMLSDDLSPMYEFYNKNNALSNDSVDSGFDEEDEEPKPPGPKKPKVKNMKAKPKRRN